MIQEKLFNTEVGVRIKRLDTDQQNQTSRTLQKNTRHLLRLKIDSKKRHLGCSLGIVANVGKNIISITNGRQERQTVVVVH